MKPWLGSLVALASISLLCSPNVWAAPDGNETHKAAANAHASLKAYPSAIITLKDPNSGALYYVESNGRRLIAFDKTGAVSWNIDVLDAIKDMALVGQPVIRNLKLDHGQLTVTIAKHAYCEVDVATGSLKFVGAD